MLRVLPTPQVLGIKWTIITGDQADNMCLSPSQAPIKNEIASFLLKDLKDRTAKIIQVDFK